MLKVYNKLVRDKIPQICIADGETPKIKILSKPAYHKALKKKSQEEAAELLAARGLDLKKEMVDVYEVLLNIARTYRISWPEIERMRKTKNQKRGSFRKRIFLISSKK